MSQGECKPGAATDRRMDPRGADRIAGSRQPNAMLPVALRVALVPEILVSVTVQPGEVGGLIGPSGRAVLESGQMHCATPTGSRRPTSSSEQHAMLRPHLHRRLPACLGPIPGPRRTILGQLRPRSVPSWDTEAGRRVFWPSLCHDGEWWCPALGPLSLLAVPFWATLRHCARRTPHGPRSSAPLRPPYPPRRVLCLSCF